MSPSPFHEPGQNTEVLLPTPGLKAIVNYLVQVDVEKIWHTSFWVTPNTTLTSYLCNYDSPSKQKAPLVKNMQQIRIIKINYFSLCSSVSE